MESGIEKSTAWTRLADLKPDQRIAFEALSARFAPLYRLIRGDGEERYLADFYSSAFAQLEPELLPMPSFSFLHSTSISKFIIPSPVKEEARGYLANLSCGLSQARFDALIQEDPVGEPPGMILDPLTSHNQVRIMNDLLHFGHAARCEVDQFDTVVEWGGGYGCLAKLFRRLRAKPATYIIVDFSLMSCVQWLYLATIFGEGSVHLLTGRDDRIEPGKINLVPLALIEKLPPLRAELFISMFALTESSELAQRHVVSREWFGAQRLFFSSFARSRRFSCETVIEGLKASGARFEKMGGDHDTFFAFR